jgi:protein Mpv17
MLKQSRRKSSDLIIKERLKMNVIAAYNTQLMARPLITKAWTSFLLFGLGDVLAQRLEKSYGMSQKFDVMRTLKMSAFGGVVAAPALHTWYTFGITRFNFIGGWKAAVAKVSVDQTAFATCFISTFFVSMTLMNGGSFSDGVKKVKEDIWQTMCANWKIWPAVQAVNFTLVPVHYQVLTVNVVSIGWNTYLSYMQFADKTKVEEKSEVPEVIVNLTKYMATILYSHDAKRREEDR